MKNFLIRCASLMLLALGCSVVYGQTVDSEGRYFVQDFEDQSTYPDETKKGANQELTFTIEGQGTWIYYNAYVSTNSSYNVNGIEYVGEAPDLGAYEYDGEISTAIKVVRQESADQSVRLFQAQNGMLFVTVNDANSGRDYTLSLYDTNGRILGQHTFCGVTTAIRLPQTVQGLVLVRVQGVNGFEGATKALVR